MNFNFDAKRFYKERNDAFIEVIMEDKTEKLEAYCKKYGIPMPDEQKVVRAAVCKAAQLCYSIPDEVKEVAKRTCIEMGFYPYMEVRERDQ